MSTQDPADSSENGRLQGVPPDLMSARRGELDDEWFQEPDAPVPLAALSPYLIPFAAFLTGPLIAALLTLFSDGRPPRGHQALGVLGLAGLIWLGNFAIFHFPLTFTSQSLAAAHLALHLVSGGCFFALYRYWIGGAVTVDQRGLLQTALVFTLLSAAFWFGQDTTWWSWLGR